MNIKQKHKMNLNVFINKYIKIAQFHIRTSKLGFISAVILLKYNTMFIIFIHGPTFLSENHNVIYLLTDFSASNLLIILYPTWT